jgi:hypothetical protein
MSDDKKSDNLLPFPRKDGHTMKGLPLAPGKGEPMLESTVFQLPERKKQHRFIGLMCPSDRFPETAHTLEDNGFEVVSGSLVFIPTGNGQLTSFSFVCGKINRLAPITAIELKVKADSERLVKPI